MKAYQVKSQRQTVLIISRYLFDPGMSVKVNKSTPDVIVKHIATCLLTERRMCEEVSGLVSDTDDTLTAQSSSGILSPLPQTPG